MEGGLNWNHSTLFIGDNLDVMRGMNSGQIDLIYLDPPFNSNHNYAAPTGSEADGAAFKDTWTLQDIDDAWQGQIAGRHAALLEVIEAAGRIHSDSMKSYLLYMTIRLSEMKRLLKPKGSIYLHCDPTAGHYLKLAMDAIFGASQYQTSITWKRTFAHGDKVFGNISDSILFYGEPCKLKNEIYVPLDSQYINRHFKNVDARGQYQAITLTGAGASKGESGQPWKNIDPTHSDRHWSPPKTGRVAEWIEAHCIPNYRSIKGVHARLEKLDRAGLIFWPKKTDGTPRLKRYLMETDGKIPSNIWTDIPPLSHQSREHTKFPTQKPLALLKRIIEASSEKGDLVFDPFCGCGTVCVAAEKLERKWAGCDISPMAGQLMQKRISKELGLTFTGQVTSQVPIRTECDWNQ